MGTRRIGHRAVGWVVATASSGTVAIGQELEDEARRQVQAIYADKAAWAPAQTKLDTSLLYASRASRGQPMAQGMTTDKDLAAVRRVANRARVEAGGTVVVDIRAKVTDGLILAIAGAGARSCSRSRPWTPSGRGFRCGKSRRSPRRFPIEESKTAP